MTFPPLPREFGRSLRKRLQQNIIDEMPTGSHEARADAWRKLARRCDAAANAHAAVVRQRQETRRIVQAFAPAYRQAALDALQKNVPITFQCPEGFDVRNIEPDMCVEDFRALCDEEASKAERVRTDAKLLAMAAVQADRDRDPLVPLTWASSQVKLDALYTAIPGSQYRRVPGTVTGVCPYSPTCKGHGGWEPADGLGGHFDCVGPTGPDGVPGDEDPDAWYAAEVKRLKDRGPA